MEIEMTTTCRDCGQEWQPTHADYLKGLWRQCMSCRDGPVTVAPETTAPDPRPQQNVNKTSTAQRTSHE